MLRLWLFGGWLLVAWLCSGVACAHAAGAISPSPVGQWVSANHTIVLEIAPCGEELCGRITGIVLAHAGDPMPMNWLGAPQCGTTMLRVAPVTGGALWVGTLLDPRNGNVYQASIALNDSGQLLLHGYLGLPIFGLTQIWKPFTGHTLAGCELPNNSLDGSG